MRSQEAESGAGVTGALLALFLFVFVAITVYIYVAQVWPMPPSITQVGDWIDSQYNITLWVTGIIFILAQLGLAWVVFRYRDRGQHGQRARFSHGNTTLEILWTSATLILFLVLGAMAVHAWAQVHFVSPAPDALQVDVMAEQFRWNFRYPGPDGKFAPTSPTQYDDSLQNYFGILPNSTDKDDIVSPTLVVPVNQEVELHLESKDVIHSFFVRELRIKQDVVPGMVIPIHFTARETGNFELICAQLCGQGHNTMHSYLKVVTQAEFQQWLKQQEAENQQ